MLLGSKWCDGESRDSGRSENGGRDKVADTRFFAAQIVARPLRYGAVMEGTGVLLAAGISTSSQKVLLSESPAERLTCVRVS